MPKSGGAESNKISYWLEKLFRQEADQIESQKKEKRVERISQSPAKYPSENPPSQNRSEVKSVETKGIEEAHKNHSRHKEVDQQKLGDLVSKSNRILISISSMFPWDFFVNTINVEDTRVTIVYRQLFSSQALSIDIKDIHNVFIDTSLMFASLSLVSRTYVQNQLTIGKLRKKEAIMVRRIIEGLRMFAKGDIDTTTYSPDELLNKLKELSTTKTGL